ncbi:MAG: glutamate racemase [Eubacteriales bacterium]|nr:glutamate racemase [Eubacteriales bacterium]MDD3503543.1 glutamate racemase [Eubacteriales bacterium]MDD4681790.1 glutamate racemase [Eubacteriales bacterium]
MTDFLLKRDIENETVDTESAEKINPLADKAIGVFDSGLGGLTVLKEIIKLLPNENTVYFGDSGRTPYGSKSADTVRRFSRQNTRFLLEQGVKMIVIACNTASAQAYNEVRQIAGVPVIEVITPGAQAAVAKTTNRRIGVIGTRGTVQSGVYAQALARSSGRQLHISQQACPLFVGLAEEGWWNNDIVKSVAGVYLEPLIKDNIDTLVLGCTHYPLLAEAIGQVMGPEVELINAGHFVAEQVMQQLRRDKLLNAQKQLGWHQYFTSDSASHFQQLGSSFLEQRIQAAGHIEIENY